MDDDADLGAATFENDGTFTRIATTQKSNTEKQSKPTSKSASDPAPAQTITVSSRGNPNVKFDVCLQAPSQQHKDEKKSDESIAPSAVAAPVSALTVSTAAGNYQFWMSRFNSQLSFALI